jgi:hypothetical protein
MEEARQYSALMFAVTPDLILDPGRPRRKAGCRIESGMTMKEGHAACDDRHRCSGGLEARTKGG